jgi:hypothetical protein
MPAASSYALAGNARTSDHGMPLAVRYWMVALPLTLRRTIVCTPVATLLRATVATTTAPDE